jgi:hypothetical protein
MSYAQPAILDIEIKSDQPRTPGARYPLYNLYFACKPSGMTNLQGAKIASRSIEAA